jgi:hypothetical protein
MNPVTLFATVCLAGAVICLVGALYALFIIGR